MSDYQTDLASMVKNQAKLIADNKKDIKRDIRAAYKQGRTVPYDMRTLVESGVSANVIRAVYRS